LLAVYLFAYLLIELAVFAVALLTLQMKRFEEGHGRVLKLVGDMVMVALTLVLVLNPELMNDITGTPGVFMGWILLATAVILLHRRATAGQSRGETR
ncbi:MAG: thioredoxin, partial [Thioalkalivibrio sp.]|nr:thioredoxin [Thioalkalivibrio sp.]